MKGGSVVHERRTSDGTFCRVVEDMPVAWADIPSNEPFHILTDFRYSVSRVMSIHSICHDPNFKRLLQAKVIVGELEKGVELPIDTCSFCNVMSKSMQANGMVCNFCARKLEQV